MIALSPTLAVLAAEGGNVAGKCNGRTCGAVAVFGVALMFLVLCGGVFMLLQSSFGVVQGYLISGVAFWMSWFVLALIWFTGVPGVPIDMLPGIDRGIPESTPRFAGPQGRLESWEPISEADVAVVSARTDFVPAAGSTREADNEAVSAAESAAAEVMAEFYAKQLGTEPAKVTVPGTVLVNKDATQIVRYGGVKYVKFTSKAATPGETALPEEKELITKIKPADFIFELDKGTESQQTYIALPATFGLFVLHLFGLMWYERRHKPAAIGARSMEREKVSAV